MFTLHDFRRELGLISELLAKEYLSESKEYGFSKSLDGKELQRLFSQVASQYCVLILKKTQVQCNGCKNVTCPDNGTCISDINDPEGYKCPKTTTITTKFTTKRTTSTTTTTTTTQGEYY